MTEQHCPLRGTPSGLMRLVIDRTLRESMDLTLTTGGSDPIELSLAQVMEVDGKGDGPEVIFYGAEIRMLRDYFE
ncbi:hypothetical protein [Dictyobacter arantiisoli]|uniref:Uncharacterized protein n=1 Tax=Dictyobacter arantiisoli TaxID=2014874 RepID=A0A5A5TI42_9CHLR|nr:hypothetical protein [Dictyobacter arantiisoli]GCF11271.1 hypothetical protein KDI_48350 [Dictyobacter arantiisoli]